MDRWLGGYSDVIYAAMRIVVGLLYAAHGAQKLFGVLGGQSQLGNPMLLTAGVIEFGGGLLVAMGLWAGYAAFIASGQMASAYLIGHAGSGWSPLANKGELAVVYCFVFLFIAAKGSGRLSADALMGKKSV